jgi:NAD(P)-dependent dehydrogenase (short-subunit alcohol dehydrogenase family)
LDFAAMSKNESLSDGERGVIINAASIAGYEGTIGQVGYAAAKGGVIRMTSWLPAITCSQRLGDLAAWAPPRSEAATVALLGGCAE